MNAIISVGGRFWAFHQAEQLNNRNILEYIITTSCRKGKEKIPDEKIRLIRSPEIISLIFRKLPFFNKATIWNSAKDNLFDELASSNIDKCDIFIGYASYSLKTMARAKKLGALTILERGNLHISDQNRLIGEEYEKLGSKFVVNGSLTRKQLLEYDEADYICVPCEYIRKSFIDHGFHKDKVFVLSLGVDVSKFKKLPKQDNKFRVIYAGGIQARKGIIYLLEAFSKISSLDAELILVGTVYSEMKKVMKRYDGLYRYYHPVDQSKLIDFYSNSSVFVIPSLDDGFAMVTAEAMACGLPLIVSQNTGITDVIEENKHCFIVPIRDSDAIASKIEILYKDRALLEHMSQEAQIKSRTLTWDSYGERMLKTYNNLLSDHKE